ncbi:hypothetical protein BDY17DRAFT_294561 [Neohortaea acidophila]|uniref:Uncharacterized protein n=1 Tax=Neohortaea acidophila TaxID=245834 RepID=A0A6A6PVU7_9PEZI|nr:uncharacterized protein BDY17DRAFT_294561 [Neohortaea acidophila]KAF2483864.1 hypothetical protein BDY17DRAFT_294561 [Neohortaea acidophila]
MKKFLTLSTTSTLLALASAQNVTVPTTCTGNFTAGTDEVLFTVPYTYDQVISIIGNYQNLTWSGSPAGSVKLNGTDNTVGTARTYPLDGLTVIETILNYSKPASPGPYEEVHNTALLNLGTYEFFIPYDGTTVTEYCGGKASQFNFTAHFCSTNVTAAGALLHEVHLTDAETVGKFLGGKNFTSCAALGGGNAPPASSSTLSATSTTSAAGGSTGMSSATTAASSAATSASSSSASVASGLAPTHTAYAGLGAGAMAVVGAVLML